MRKCLVISKNNLPGAEKELIRRIKEYCEVEITCTSEMIRNQAKYFSSNDYHLILTFGGDGTVLKGISILSPKKRIGDLANYIDKLGDDHWTMHITENADLHLSSTSLKSTLPLIFSFDYSTKGRLCNIKKNMFNTGHRAILDYLKKTTQGNTKEIEKYYTTALRRERFIVNESIFALNEIYIFCNEKGFLDSFELSINGKIVYSSIRCDGIIICTASGSSGYNASANGPILSSDLECLAITTVCAADKKVSPIVISSKSKISIKSASNHQKLEAVIDGCLRTENSRFDIDYSETGTVYFANLETDPYHKDFLCSIQEMSCKGKNK
ncbi:NAD+ kinase [Nematocida sp. AWRm80]|nr:NAD+ kinase [Nematocida sp. AWRm80]